MPPPAVKPPAAHIEWAKYLREKVPGDVVHIARHYDEGERNVIAIFTSENAAGIVAATVGVMDYDQARQGKPPLATEILFDARGRPASIANIAATIGFYIIKDGWRVAPGVTFAEMVSMYEPGLRVRHVVFVPPFQWDEGMTRVALSDRTVYPLLAVPITDGELRLVQEQGANELQERWERFSTDVLDWSREGVA
jgi:antitoxin YqcF